MTVAEMRSMGELRIPYDIGMLALAIEYHLAYGAAEAFDNAPDDAPEVAPSGDQGTGR